MMIRSILLAPVPFLLTGCLSNPPQMPILTCAGECTYYGPAPENPNVAMAKVLTGGAVKLGLGLANADVLKSALGGNNNSTIERTTTTNNTSVTDRDHSNAVNTAVSDTSVSDTSVFNTSVSDTSVFDTSVSDTSSSNVSSVTSIGE